MGLKCLLATVGSFFILAFSSVAAEPATLPFTDCFTGNASSKMQVSTVYGQTLSDRYLNFTIIGDTPVGIVSASNNTNAPVASACHPNSFISLQCCLSGPVLLILWYFSSYPFHDHQPTHVQCMEQWILLLRHTSSPVSPSLPRCGFRRHLLSLEPRSLRILHHFEVSGGLRTRHIQHPSPRLGP